MRASVVVNAHAGTDFEQFRAAVDSILEGTYEDIELVIVIADAPEVHEQIEDRYGHHDAVELLVLDTDEGLSPARNAGAEAATGDVVVFTDDDVIADPGWLDALVEIYDREDPVGVGGHVVPIWPDDEPWYLPAEFYWLVGVVHEGFVNEKRPQQVRNTFGCNISFDRESFLNVGGFREDLGKNQDNPLQGEEAEICTRIDGEFWYNPDALVEHRVDPGQLEPGYLLRRAFWQGYSKAALAEGAEDESSFLRTLFLRSLPRRLKKPTLTHLVQVVVLLGLTAGVGFGFVYGKL